MDWSHVDYRDVFISCLDFHSDGTHSLQRIHWWASDVMLNFSKSVLMKKQTLSWPGVDFSLSDWTVHVLMVQLLLPQILYVAKNYKADLQELLQEKYKKSYNSPNILILLLLGFDRVKSVLYQWVVVLPPQLAQKTFWAIEFNLFLSSLGTRLSKYSLVW